MPYIKVDMNALSSLGDVLSISRTRISDIGDDFSDITWWLDWDVKSDEVKKKINAVKNAIGNDTEKLKKMYDFLQEAIKLYDSANIDPETKEMQEREERAKWANTLNWGVAILAVAATIAVTVATGGAALPMILVSAGTGALSAGVNNWGEQYVEKGADGVDWGEVGGSAVIGGVTGAVTGAISAGSSAVTSKVSQTFLNSAKSGMGRIGRAVVVEGVSEWATGAVSRGTETLIETGGDMGAAWKEATDGKDMAIDLVSGMIGGGYQEYSSLKKVQQHVDAKTARKNSYEAPIPETGKKGVQNLKKTDTGSPDFSDSNKVMRTDTGEAVEVKIKTTTNKAANRQAATDQFWKSDANIDVNSVQTYSDTRQWHSVADYDVMTGESTMQMIDNTTYKKAKDYVSASQQKTMADKAIQSRYEKPDMSKASTAEKVKAVFVKEGSEFDGTDLRDYVSPGIEGWNDAVEQQGKIYGTDEGEGGS